MTTVQVCLPVSNSEIFFLSLWLLSKSVFSSVTVRSFSCRNDHCLSLSSSVTVRSFSCRNDHCLSLSSSQYRQDSLSCSSIHRLNCFTQTCFREVLAGTKIAESGKKGNHTWSTPSSPKRFCFKMGSNESHFKVPLIVRGKVTRQCP